MTINKWYADYQKKTPYRLSFMYQHLAAAFNAGKSARTVRAKAPHNKAKVAAKPKFCACEEMHSYWWKYCASCGGKIKRKTSTLA